MVQLIKKIRDWLFRGAPPPWFTFQEGKDICHPFFKLDPQVAENYLGPREEWWDMPVNLVSIRFLERGWILPTPLVTDTIYAMRKNILQRVDVIRAAPGMAQKDVGQYL